MKNIIYVTIILTNILSSQSDNQIEQAKKIAEQYGLTKSEVIKEAKSRGYSDAEIEAVIEKEKSKKIIKQESSSLSEDNAFLPDLDKANEKIESGNNLDSNDNTTGDEDDYSIESKTASASTTQSFFGLNFFKQDPAIFQASSTGAVDPDYLIGPGDEIIIMLWGETEFRQVLTINREGFVFIPEIGQVFVNGLNLNLLESKLFKVFSQSYASLNPDGRKPTTFLDVSLGMLRPLRVQVLGEVAQPGAYTVSPTTTLFSSLYYFGGPTTLGSLRDIHLIRNGEKIASIDFYDYLLTGKKPQDQKLQLDDIIYIPSRLKTVSVEGEINRSGIYELKPKETLFFSFLLIFFTLWMSLIFIPCVLKHHSAHGLPSAS